MNKVLVTLPLLFTATAANAALVVQNIEVRGNGCILICRDEYCQVYSDDSAAKCKFEFVQAAAETIKSHQEKSFLDGVINK